MMEFLLSLNEFTMSAMTILLLAILTATYRLNSRLVQYAIVGKKWEVTNKINKLGKRMVMFGGVATLPMMVLLLPFIDIDSELFKNLIVISYMAWISGYFILIVALPVLLIALVERVHLSELLVADFLMAVFETTKSKLQPHWRTIALSVTAITLLVVIWPLIQGLLYIGAVLFLGWIGALDDNEKEFNDSSYLGIDPNPDGLLGAHNVITGKVGYSWEPGSILFEENE